MQNQPLETIAEERQFLHAMATPLATMSLLIESIIENAEAQPNPNSNEVARLQQLHQLLQRVNNLLRDRRSMLIARSENKTTTSG